MPFMYRSRNHQFANIADRSRSTSQRLSWGTRCRRRRYNAIGTLWWKQQTLGFYGASLESIVSRYAAKVHFDERKDLSVSRRTSCRRRQLLSGNSYAEVSPDACIIQPRMSNAFGNAVLYLIGLELRRTGHVLDKITLLLRRSVNGRSGGSLGLGATTAGSPGAGKHGTEGGHGELYNITKDRVSSLLVPPGTAAQCE